MNTFIFITAQIVGFLGWCFLVYSYRKENIKELLLLQTISSILYIINYALCGATAGVYISLFELAKGISFMFSDKDEFIYFVTLPVYLVIAYFTFDITSFGMDSIIGWVGILASIIAEYGLTQNQNGAIITAIISYIMWFAYDFYFGSYSVAITDILLVMSNISLLVLGYNRLLKVDKFNIVKCHYLSRSIAHTMYRLDQVEFGDNVTWTEDDQINSFKEQNDSILLIKYKTNIVGYINYFIITEEAYEKLKEEKHEKKRFSKESLIGFRKNKKNYMVIESINVDKKYQNYKTIKLIKTKFRSLIHQRYHQGYRITSIISQSYGKFEKEFFEETKFNCLKEYNSNEYLYELDEEGLKDYFLTKDYKTSEKFKDYKVHSGEKITDKYLMEIEELDSKFYKQKYLWLYQHRKEIFEKNKESLIVLTKHNNIIGYINYLTINEDLYKKIKKSDITIDDFEPDDIYRLRKTYPNYLVFKSIVLDENYRDKSYLKLINKRLKFNIKGYTRKGYKIKGIISTATTKDGRKYLEELGFIQVKKLDSNNYLYELNESGINEYINE